MEKENKQNNALTLIGLAILAMAGVGDDKMRSIASMWGIASPEETGTNVATVKGKDNIDYIKGVRGLADYLGISPPTAIKYIKEGKLDGALRKVGAKKYVFLRDEIDKCLARTNNK